MSTSRATVVARDTSPTPDSRVVWARVEAPWLDLLAQGHAAGSFDPGKLGVEPQSLGEAEQAHWSRLIEAVGVLLPWVDETGPAWFATALRERRLRYLDRRASVPRGTVTG